ncbi:reverse transcriptase domain-containing protein [Tanacetum coccineum]|uniref:Reverse transcriptase domain-containing protein n=1 Tax=Tanacetum coccineum TaxID=301880 RepID=A0ABQ4YPU1_9ASTR
MPKVWAIFSKGICNYKVMLDEAFGYNFFMNIRLFCHTFKQASIKRERPREFYYSLQHWPITYDNALADLGASISLMPYTIYKKLGLGEPKDTRMSLELVDRSIQYPRGIIENVLIKVDKFFLPIDFVILDMPEGSRVPIILGRPFLTTVGAMIDVFNKKITLRVGDGLEKSIDQSDLECCESTSSNDKNGSDSKNLTRHIDSINMPYPVTQGTSNEDNVKYSSWVIPIHVVPKKGGITVVLNDNNELIPSRIVTGWRVNEYYYFLDGFSGFFQIPIAPEDQEKNTFTCPYGTFAYRRMPFGLCNFPATFQRGMTVIFHDMVEVFMEVFMDDFSVFGAENLAADHLSRLENPDLGTFVEEEITDEFPDERLMILKAKLNNDEPWYADYINYIVGKIIPPNWTPEKRRRFFSQVKYYFWDEPYAFKLCSDNVMRRCVAGNEIFEILAHCHSGPTGGHHSASITRRKVYESGFYWPSIFKDAKDYVMKCDACQRSGNISSRSEMPQNNIQMVLGNLSSTCAIDTEAYWALKQCNIDLIAAAKNRFMELNELMELRDEAYENTRFTKNEQRNGMTLGFEEIKISKKEIRWTYAEKSLTWFQSMWKGERPWLELDDSKSNVMKGAEEKVCLPDGNSAYAPQYNSGRIECR